MKVTKDKERLGDFQIEKKDKLQTHNDQMKHIHNNGLKPGPDKRFFFPFTKRPSLGP